jgi:lysyl-tRNA synthetase class 2
MTSHWQPTAPYAALQARARLYQQIRQFFAARAVLEVETPVLSAAAVPEPAIAPFYTHYHYGKAPQPLFLQTSPELPMKRLLAAGSGPIYQIAKVFRDGEQGARHNPEFSLLEWYRPGFDQAALLTEIDQLLQAVLACPAATIKPYCAAFEQYVGCCPLHTPLAELQKRTAEVGYVAAEHLDREGCLQFLVAHFVEPHLGPEAPLFLIDFPASQAALARKKPDNPQLAARFEVYFQGIELANGFEELTDPLEQRTRFETELALRAAQGLPTFPLDERFLAALAAGLPPCSGVALGLDRLLMLQLGATHIDQVLAFPINIA